jgi:hypothetical protein
VQTIRLIDQKPRIDLRTGVGVLALMALVAAGAFVVGTVLDIEMQVVGMVIIDVMLLTAIVCFYELTFAIILWFFALTFILRYTQLNLPGIPDMSGPRFMLVVMWGVFFIEVALRRRKALPIGKIEWLMLYMIVLQIVSMIHHQNLMHTAQRQSPITSFMNATVFPFTVYYLARNASSSDRNVYRMLVAFALLCFHLSVTGILEHFRVKGLVYPPDILDPEAGGGRWYGVRVRGPYLSTPIYGAAVGICFYLTLHFYRFARGWKKAVCLIGLAATPLTILYTLTRQVWIGWVLPMFLGLTFSKPQRLVIAVFLLVGLCASLLINWDALIDRDILEARAGNVVTGESRIGQYAAGFYMFMDRPIVGCGLEMWELTMEEYRRKLTTLHTPFGDVDMRWSRGAHAHNTFLRVAVELGLLGLIPFVLLHWFIIYDSWKLWRRLPAGGLYGRGLVVAYWQLMLVYLICISFVDPSAGEFLPGIVFAWSGIIVRRAELAEEQAAGRPIPPGHTLAPEVA